VMRNIPELPTFGAYAKAISGTQDVHARSSQPKAKAGSVEAIIQEFQRSMEKSSRETRDMRHMVSEVSVTGMNALRETWAQNVSGVEASGLTTPLEGRSDFGGHCSSLMTSGSVSSLRSPRKSPRSARNAPSSSLKRAAAAVVSQSNLSTCRSGSGLLNSPRNGFSPPGSAREIPRDESARSLMLAGPWQQFKSVTMRAQQEQVSESQMSTPRTRGEQRNARGARQQSSLQPGEQRDTTQTSQNEAISRSGQIGEC
jgi:hypothetical protein